jgi:DNA-binding NarL/FixJ family response regulator
LFVDDIPEVRVLYRRRIERRTSIRFLDVGSAIAALTLLENDARVDVLVSDLRMRGLHGDELLEEVGRRWPSIKRVLLTSFSDGEMVATAGYLVLDKTLDSRFIADTIVGLARTP